MKTRIGIDTGDRKVVSVRFSMEAHFDRLVELNDDSIEKLRKEIGRSVYNGDVIHRMLSSLASNSTFDFAYAGEDIEIHEAEILPDYPYHSGKEIQIENL